MLRRALVVAAFATLALACKKADSKEVGGAAEAADSRVAATGGGSGDKAVTPGSSADPGSAAAKDPVGPTEGSAQASGSARGTAAPTKGSSDGAQPTGAETTTGDGSFQLTITAPDPVAPGAAATAKLVVKPGKGFHMNKDFPTKLTIEPPAGVTLAQTTFEGEDAEEFTEDELVFAVDCTPASAGTYQVAGKLKFAVCTESTCDPKRQAISFAVAAK